MRKHLAQVSKLLTWAEVAQAAPRLQAAEQLVFCYEVISRLQEEHENGVNVNVVLGRAARAFPLRVWAEADDHAAGIAPSQTLTDLGVPPGCGEETS